MRIMALPRDANPYQELLYTPMREMGTRVAYLQSLTPSHTLNLLLLPLEIAWRRLLGWRHLHIHWVYGFALPWARGPIGRRLSGAIFAATLGLSRRIGVSILWTAHNLLPHEQVFLDDEVARRRLVSACATIFVHGDHLRPRLAAWGAVDSQIVTIDIGPMTTGEPPTDNPPTEGPRHLAFIGQVRADKGVEDLLVAIGRLPRGAITATIAGACPESGLGERLEMLAEGLDDVDLRLNYLSDGELETVVTTADFVVLPFRSVTTSSSARLALQLGRPLIVPDLPALADLPDEATLRYHGGLDGLAEVLAEAGAMSVEHVMEMRAAAVAFARDLPTWAEAGDRTRVALSTPVEGSA